MYDITPLVLVLISLSIIIIIVVRKFSVLANLNVNEIQAEKEARFKEQIISNRLKRNIVKWNVKVMKIFQPIGNAFSQFFKLISKKINDFKEDVDNDRSELTEEELKQKVEKIFIDAYEFEKKGELSEAEKKYIEIIGLDSKNIKAFENLANIYFKRKEFNEAKQTFGHILKLTETDNDESGNSRIHFELALVNKAMDDKYEALENIKRALAREPNNPRYLDTMAEISIIIKDKVIALEAFEKLKEVNPENGKLNELESQIRDL